MVNGNIYIESLDNLFTEMYAPKINDNEYKLFKSKGVKKAQLECEKVYRELKNKDLDYVGIKNFADFINYLEKVFFYKNISYSNNVTVMSPIDSKKKTIWINTTPELTRDSKNIKDARALVVISAYFDYNSSDPRDTISITITRSTGRAIENKFIVLDGSMKYNDEYEPLSIVPINRLVRDSFGKLYYNFYNLMCCKRIFDFEYREDIFL